MIILREEKPKQDSVKALQRIAGILLINHLLFKYHDYHTGSPAFGSP
jgi:hypothetical protein